MTEDSGSVCADLLTAWKTHPMAKDTGIATNAAGLPKNRIIRNKQPGKCMCVCVYDSNTFFSYQCNTRKLK